MPFEPTFQAEPPFQHPQVPRTAVLLCNLGTPEAPTAVAVRRYLAEFLSDRRVVEIPKWLWMPILHGIILRFRPKKSAAKYASIWTEQGSPLKLWTQRQAEALGRLFESERQPITVRYAMRYGSPSIEAVLNQLKAEGHQRILLLPAYPQYSGTTTASVFDAVYRWGLKTRWLPEMRFINQYHDDRRYIEALAVRIEAHWQAHGRGTHLLMSFHGVPERTLHLGDPYHCQCYKTARLLAERLGVQPGDYTVSFQSRFGKAKWLAPYTEPTLVALAKQGVAHVDVVCPGFISDCLETLEEISDEARHTFLSAGGQRFEYIACLNDSAQFIHALHGIALDGLSGWPMHLTPAQELKARHGRATALGAQQ